jgi:serine/threonine protein phosphatase 1
MGILDWLKKGARSQPAAAPFDAPMRPEAPFYAIGDVHGCNALLTRLMEKITTEDPAAHVVLVGDYIDRGEDSAAVLRRIRDWDRAPDRPLTFLTGNHEDMLLKFLDAPEDRAARWLRYGGLQTMASFGVGGVSDTSKGAELRAARDALARAMGDDLIEWLRALPTHWQTGNVAVVHAGADPDLPMAEQEARVLKWGHQDFRHLTRRDGIWVVHGHTIVEHARAEQGRIAVDTGAYATGRLTAVHVSGEGARFLQT